MNIDFEDEQDMVEKMRIGLALQPLATALFSNSPFRGGQDTGQKFGMDMSRKGFNIPWSMKYQSTLTSPFTVGVSHSVHFMV